MSLLIVVAFASVACLVAYAQTARAEARTGAALFGINPQLWGIAGFVVGFVTATVVPALLVGALTFVVGYEHASTLERQRGERWRNVPAPAWGAAGAVLGVALAVVATPVIAAGAVGVLAVVAELVLTKLDNARLATENYALQVENKKLVAQRNALESERPAPPMSAPTPNPAARPASVLRMKTAADRNPVRNLPRPDATTRTWSGQSTARPEGDLLPGGAKRPPVVARPSGNDLLPRHR